MYLSLQFHSILICISMLHQYKNLHLLLRQCTCHHKWILKYRTLVVVSYYCSNLAAVLSFSKCVYHYLVDKYNLHQYNYPFRKHPQSPNHKYNQQIQNTRNDHHSRHLMLSILSLVPKSLYFYLIQICTHCHCRLLDHHHPMHR